MIALDRERKRKLLSIKNALQKQRDRLDVLKMQIKATVDRLSVGETLGDRGTLEDGRHISALVAKMKVEEAIEAVDEVIRFYYSDNYA